MLILKGAMLLAKDKPEQIKAMIRRLEMHSDDDVDEEPVPKKRK